MEKLRQIFELLTRFDSKSGLNIEFDGKTIKVDQQNFIKTLSLYYKIPSKFEENLSDDFSTIKLEDITSKLVDKISTLPKKPEKKDLNQSANKAKYANKKKRGVIN